MRLSAEGGRVAGQRVLVVEDEMFVRLILQEILDEEGFEVVAVETGDEAVGLIDGPDGFDAVVTDIHMPGSTDGIAVGRHVRERHQGLPVIYLTGMPDALNALGHLGHNEAVFRKPYYPSRVVAKLNKMLNNSA